MSCFNWDKQKFVVKFVQLTLYLIWLFLKQDLVVTLYFKVKFSQLTNH